MAHKAVTFEGRVIRSAKLSGYHIVYLSSDIVQTFTVKGKFLRLQVTVQGVKYTAAIRSDGEGGYYMHIGKRILHQIKAQADARLTFKLTEDRSELGFEIPEEFTAVLETDPEGKAIWEELTTGIQRSLMYYIATAKQSQTRITRALQIMEKIKFTRLPKRKS